MANRREGEFSGEAYAFFLGGADLEMDEIRALLDGHPDLEIHDRRLTWGAKVSDYSDEIAGAIARGKIVVLVELEDDLPLPSEHTLVLDHHGARSGASVPTTMEQLFAFLRLPGEAWTRWHALVAANDRGFVEEMVSMGAARDEMLAVRDADRRAQGVTAEEEKEAERATAAREDPCPKLTIVRLRHGRTAPVTDRLHSQLGGQGYLNLLIICPGETFFFGEGQHVVALAELRHGFHGGALPERGYWGVASVEKFVRARICGVD